MMHVITSLADGGAEAVLYRLCQHDRENQHTVVTLRDQGKYGALLRELGIPVHCLNLSPWLINPGPLVRLWYLLRRERPDVVQTWMYHADLIGGVLARLAGVRSVVWGIHHTTLERGKTKLVTIWVAKLCAVFSRWVPQRIVCCGESAASAHGALGYFKKKLVVIHNGYDLDHFRPDAVTGLRVREELGLPGDEILLGMVARLDPLKDHKNLLKAVSKLQNQGYTAYCILVGRDVDDTNRRLAGWIARYGLQGRVLTLGARSDVNAVMNALDIHVLASFGEAFPNVVAEAMACGVPCVVTEVGDAAVIVGETGWIVPVNDWSALAEALITALECRANSESWKRRQERARDRIQERFSVGSMVERYQRVWSEARHRSQTSQ